MKTINKNELVDILMNSKGSQFVNLTYKTIQKVVKKNNTLFIEFPIVKIVKQTVHFNYSYENAVNNRLNKQINAPKIEFKALSLPWGTWHTTNKLISNNGLIYARFYLTNTNNKKEIHYFYDGHELTGSELEAAKNVFVKTNKMGNRQTQLNPTEQVKPINVNIDNILSININKNNYQILS